MNNDFGTIRLGSAIGFNKENPDIVFIQWKIGPMEINFSCRRIELKQIINQWNEALKNAPDIAIIRDHEYGAELLRKKINATK